MVLQRRLSKTLVNSYRNLHLAMTISGRMFPFILISGSCGSRNIFLEYTDVLNFTSPGFPMQYPPNLECLWHIFADDNIVIVVRIRSFNLERGFDYLTIGDGNEAGNNKIARLTGQIKVRTVTSGSPTMWMMLVTDNTGNMPGFYLEIEQIPSEEVNSKF